MRIVHAKNAHTAFRPKQHDAFHLGPELAPVFAPEVQRINVFVFFRRVLRIFNRAVRPFVEPLGMLFDVRMIGRTIDCEIQRDFHPAFADLFLQPIEISQCAERRLDRFVSAGFAADRPRHTGIARFAGDRIVPAFAIGVPDGMNRWKINHVESHRLRVVHARQTIAESRSAIGAAFRRARKKFIPRAEQRRRTIHYHSRRWIVLRRVGAIRICRHQHLQLARLRDRVNFRVRAVGDLLGKFTQARGVRFVARPLGRAFYDGCAFQGFTSQI